MKYNKFIKGAPAVSEIGLGAWQLGVNSGWKGMTEQEAIDMVHYAYDKGINFFDTAPNYGHGTGESRLGKGLEAFDRDKIVINTKFGRTDSGDTIWDSSNIRVSVEGSLKRMQVDYVDSVIFHNPPSAYLDGNKNDHYEILELLKDEGKIKAYGASLDTYDDMKLLMETTGSKVIEAFFNILHQDAARAFHMATQKEVGIIAKIPLDSGWLTGKYNDRSSFNDIRARWSKKDIETRSQQVEKIQEIIGERDLAQTAVAFCLAFDAVSTVIPGNTNIKQLESNLKSAENTISANLVDQLQHFYSREVEKLQLPW